MKGLKNLLVGFFVSFVGSIPLGYLNIIGFEIYSQLGVNSLIFYLTGVISVEVFVIYFTLVFANQLVSNKKLMKGIDFFAIVFLLFLAYSFYAHANQTAANRNDLERYVKFSPFLIGLFLSGINFLQVPFWTGWNLYLINGNYITVGRRLKYYYVFGALVGTFFGMLALVTVLYLFFQNTPDFARYILPVIIPLFFVVLALIQMYNTYKKYYRKY
jgi:hypothetical protein